MSPVPADDPAARLAVDLVNTYDLLETPPDRLTVDVAVSLAARHGRPDLAADLPRAHLDDLRRLRDRLYRVFAGPTAEAKIGALNDLLRRIGAHATLVPGPRLAAVTNSGDPVRRLGTVCADALAHAMVVGGPGRLGTCTAHPCRCGYLDRTRAGRQRYCCQLCNDRMSAAEYRRRRR